MREAGAGGIEHAVAEHRPHEDNRGLAAALGWPTPSFTHRRYKGGASVAISAPADQLLTATSLLEWAALGQPSEAEVPTGSQRSAMSDTTLQPPFSTMMSCVRCQPRASIEMR